MAEPLLTIGVFARRSRLSIKALRLYKRLGLLLPAEIDPQTGYRRYRESQLFTARLIVGLRRLDMPLSEVVRVISVAGEVGASVLTSYWEWVERRLAAQRELAEELRQSLLWGESRFATFDIRERDQPEQIVVSETCAVDIAALTATTADMTEQLTRSAAAHGGASGERFVIYHGEVNEDSIGPIEICIPVTTESTATRREPAHRQAYVSVTKAQFGWPQILSAYDAVERWIDQHGRRRIGSPREMYRADFDPASAAPTDEACDVIFPIA
ncbi:MerR family transcriptional regulator [Kribbella sp. NPDC026611]|uniref:MerR family transcriptional regulator n=1 Tax=Kribbella sp. NPDC026611 TaxID=3154911 RepID=UPI0034111EF1